MAQVQVAAAAAAAGAGSPSSVRAVAGAPLRALPPPHPPAAPAPPQRRASLASLQGSATRRALPQHVARPEDKRLAAGKSASVSVKLVA